MLIKEIDYTDFLKVFTYDERVKNYLFTLLYTKNYSKIKIYRVTKNHVPKYVHGLIPIKQEIFITANGKTIHREIIEEGTLFQSFNNFYILKKKRRKNKNDK